MTASDIVAELDRLYAASVERLRAALTAYLVDGTPPASRSRGDGSFAYPEIRLTYAGHGDRPAPMRSFGRLVTPGEYRITVAKPARLFADAAGKGAVVRSLDVGMMLYPTGEKQGREAVDAVRNAPKASSGRST